METRKYQYNAKALHQMMKYAFRELDNNIILNYLDVEQEKLTFKYSNYSDISILDRFIKYWERIFNSHNIPIKTNQDSIEVNTSYANALAIISMAKQATEKQLQHEHEIVSKLNAKLNSLPTTKQQQESNDEKLAKLIQWQELHSDNKRGTFLTEAESKGMKEELEQQYKKFRG